MGKATGSCFGKRTSSSGRAKLGNGAWEWTWKMGRKFEKDWKIAESL